jgi:hypothetical protein
MEQSILISTKKILGLTNDYTVFDLDIITHINGALSVLSQIGVGPTNGFYVEDSSDLWTDFIPNSSILSLVKTYVFLKVRMLFDPPATSFLITAMNEQIKEYEWRISTLRESSIL